MERVVALGRRIVPRGWGHFGSHYLLDVLAGIAVAVFALLATAGVPRIVRTLGRTLGPSIANLL